MGVHPQIGRTYNCPPKLREDNTPSFSLYQEEDKLRWYDHSRAEGGDIWDLIGRCEGKDFIGSRNFYKKEIKPIRIMPQVKYMKQYAATVRVPMYGERFTSRELEYWDTFGIDEVQLKREYIYSSAGVYYENKDKTIFKSTENKLKFLYKLQKLPPTDSREAFKLYGPSPNDNIKWLSQLNDSIISGCADTTLPQSGDTLFMLSGKKDKMVFDNVAKMLGKEIHTDNPLGELAYRNIAKNEDRYSGFKNKYVLFDDDPNGAGQRATEKFIKEMKQEWIPIYVKCPPPVKGYEKCKDLANIIEQYGYQKLVEILKEYGF